MASFQKAISIQDASKIFNQGSPDEVIALTEINLDIDRGQFVALVGPSGCGKSTLLRLIADLTEATTGTILVNNRSPLEARLNREYGFVFQASTLYEWRTIRKNVQLPLEIMGFGEKERNERANEMLEMVELSRFGGHYPAQLSGGMQQRASIARALAFRPSLLLMDEPFGALDEFTRDRMNMELLHIWEQTNTTVIFVTHSIAEAVFLAQKVVVMSAHPGRIKENFDIELPYPRRFETRDENAFHDHVAKVRHSLRDAFLVEDTHLHA